MIYDKEVTAIFSKSNAFCIDLAILTDDYKQHVQSIETDQINCVDHLPVLPLGVCP